MSDTTTAERTSSSAGSSVAQAPGRSLVKPALLLLTLVVLLVRPSGLFGTRELSRV